jgi:hypothetical protein
VFVAKASESSQACKSGPLERKKTPGASDSGHTERAHSGDPKQRTAAAATACAKGSRQPVERPICSTWHHTKFPDRSRLAHTAAFHRPVLSSREASGWFLAKDLRS